MRQEYPVVTFTEEPFQDYMQKATDLITYLTGFKPSLGQRMLLRRYTQQSLEELRKINDPRGRFILVPEVVARFFCLGYHIPLSKDLENSLRGCHPLKPETKQRIDEIFKDN